MAQNVQCIDIILGVIDDLRKDVAIIVSDIFVKYKKGIGYYIVTQVIRNDTGAERSLGNVTVL